MEAEHYYSSPQIECFKIPFSVAFILKIAAFPTLSPVQKINPCQRFMLYSFSFLANSGCGLHSFCNKKGNYLLQIHYGVVTNLVKICDNFHLLKSGFAY